MTSVHMVHLSIKQSDEHVLLTIVATAEAPPSPMTPPTRKDRVENVESLALQASIDRRKAEEAASSTAALAEMARQEEAEWSRALSAASKVAQGVPNALAEASNIAKTSAVAAALEAQEVEAEAAKAARKTPWSDGYVLVAELVGSYTVERYYREKEATAAASQIWRCWVLFREKGLDYEEVTYGGVGLTHDKIRDYVSETLAALKQEARRVAIEPDPPAAAPVVAEPSGVTSLYDLLRAKIDWQVDEVDPKKMTTTDEAEDLRGKIAEAEGGPPVT